MEYKSENMEHISEGKMDNFHGDRSVVLSQKQLTFLKNNPRLEQLYLTCIGFYPHARNHFRKRAQGIQEHILIYCISGFGFIEIDGTTHEISPNSFFIIRAGTPHAYWASEKFPWTIYWVHFYGKQSEHMQDLFQETPYQFPNQDPRMDDRTGLFKEILTVLETGFRNENLEFCNLYLNSLLASFLYLETYKAAKGIVGASVIDSAIFFMQKNINQVLKIDDIANHVKLSKSHLSRVFKSETGFSPLDYFIGLKMQEAIRLLSNRSLRINEVAFMLGYRDPFYFSRIFTKHIGSSPRNFLKMKHKKTE